MSPELRDGFLSKEIDRELCPEQTKRFFSQKTSFSINLHVDRLIVISCLSRHRPEPRNTSPFVSSPNKYFSESVKTTRRLLFPELWTEEYANVNAIQGLVRGKFKLILLRSFKSAG